MAPNPQTKIGQTKRVDQPLKRIKRTSSCIWVAGEREVASQQDFLDAHRAQAQLGVEALSGWDFPLGLIWGRLGPCPIFRQGAKRHLKQRIPEEGSLVHPGALGLPPDFQAEAPPQR